jgi:hypothetical protein
MHVLQFVDLVPPDVNPARRQVCWRWFWSYPVLPTGAANSVALRSRVPCALARGSGHDHEGAPELDDMRAYSFEIG